MYVCAKGALEEAAKKKKGNNETGKCAHTDFCKVGVICLSAPLSGVILSLAALNKN